MSASQPQRQPTPPDNSRVTARHQMAKATLRDHDQPDELSTLVMDVAKAVFGKQLTVATKLGKDEGNYSRDAKAGRLTTGQLAELAKDEERGYDFLARLGRELQERFGPLATPKARAMARLNDIEDAVREVRDSLDFIAS